MKASAILALAAASFISASPLNPAPRSSPPPEGTDLKPTPRSVNSVRDRENIVISNIIFHKTHVTTPDIKELNFKLNGEGGSEVWCHAGWIDWPQSPPSYCGTSTYKFSLHVSMGNWDDYELQIWHDISGVTYTASVPLTLVCYPGKQPQDSNCTVKPIHLALNS